MRDDVSHVGEEEERGGGRRGGEEGGGGEYHHQSQPMMEDFWGSAEWCVACFARL